MRIDLIYTFFDVYEQDWFETDVTENAFTDEETFKEFLNKQIDKEQQELLCKVSCCVIGVTAEMLPDWFLKANGKMWFNDDKRAQYGLD